MWCYPRNSCDLGCELGFFSKKKVLRGGIWPSGGIFWGVGLWILGFLGPFVLSGQASGSGTLVLGHQECEPLHVISQIFKAYFDFGPRQADGVDDQPAHAGVHMAKDVFDAGSGFGPCAIHAVLVIRQGFVAVRSVVDFGL